MSLWRNRGLTFPPAAEMIPRRSAKPGRAVTEETAMHIGAVWACLRLRANLISSLPLDVFRRLPDGIQVEMPKPQVLMYPGGVGGVKIREFMYSTQVDLDRMGNCFGFIRARDGSGLPAVIELVGACEVTVIVRDAKLAAYRIRGVEYDPFEIWHEKQYTLAGLHVGLSPIMYAAWTLSEYSSIQQFATEWFDNGTLPSAVMKNTERHVPPNVAEEAKNRYKATVANGDVFVIGNDWEFDLMKAEAAGSNWIAAKQYDTTDLARFFDCPADVIDAAVSGQSITYANLTQRNLQLLIMHIGPAVGRREDALSDLLPKPRYVKLSTDALLRMDPEARAAMLGQMIRDRLLLPSEGRELDNRPPFDEAGYAEFDRLFGPPASKAGGPMQGSVSLSVPERGVTVNVPERSVNVEPAAVTVNVPEKSVVVYPPTVEVAAPEVTVNVEPPPINVQLAQRKTKVGDLV